MSVNANLSAVRNTTTPNLQAFRNAVTHDDGTLVLNDKGDALVKQNRGASKFTKYTVYLSEQTKLDGTKNASVRDAFYKAIEATHGDETCKELMDEIKSRLGLAGDANEGNKTQFLERKEVRLILEKVDQWDAEQLAKKRFAKELVGKMNDWQLPEAEQANGTLNHALASKNADSMKYVLLQIMQRVGRKAEASCQSIDSFLDRLNPNQSEQRKKFRSELLKSIQYACLKQIHKNVVKDIKRLWVENGPNAEDRYQELCTQVMNEEFDKMAKLFADTVNAFDARVEPYTELYLKCDDQIKELEKRNDMPKAIKRFKSIQEDISKTIFEVLNATHLKSEVEDSGTNLSSDPSAPLRKCINYLALKANKPDDGIKEEELYKDEFGGILTTYTKGVNLISNLCFPEKNENAQVDKSKEAPTKKSHDDEVEEKFITQLAEELYEENIGKIKDEAPKNKALKNFEDNLKEFKISDEDLKKFVCAQMLGKLGKADSLLRVNASYDIRWMVEYCKDANSLLSKIRGWVNQRPMTEDQFAELENTANKKSKDNKGRQEVIDRGLKNELNLAAFKQAQVELKDQEGIVFDFKNPVSLQNLGKLASKTEEIKERLEEQYNKVDEQTLQFFQDTVKKGFQYKSVGALSLQEQELADLQNQIKGMFETASLYWGERVERLVDIVAKDNSLTNRRGLAFAGKSQLDSVEGKIAMCKALLSHNHAKFVTLFSRAAGYGKIASNEEVRDVFNRLNNQAESVEQGKMPGSTTNWIEDLNGQLSFENIPELQQALDKYGSCSLAVEGLKLHCEEVVKQIKDTYNDYRYSLCDRIALPGTENPIIIEKGKPWPKDIADFLDGTYLQGLISQAVNQVKAGAKLLLKGLDHIEQKIQQIAPNPLEYSTCKEDTPNKPDKFTLKLFSDSCDKFMREKGKYDFATDRGLPELLHGLVMKLKSAGPLRNLQESNPTDEAKLNQEIDQEIDKFVRQSNVASLIKSDTIESYRLFDEATLKKKDEIAGLKYTYKILGVREQLIRKIRANWKEAEGELGNKALDVLNKRYSQMTFIDLFDMPNFTGTVTTDKGFLTDISKGYEKPWLKTRDEKLAYRQKSIDLNRSFEEAVEREYQQICKKSTTLVASEKFYTVVADKLHDGVTNAISNCEKRFKEMFAQKVLTTTPVEDIFATDETLNMVMKELAVKEGERYLKMGDEYQLDLKVVEREVVSYLHSALLGTVSIREKGKQDEYVFRNLGTLVNNQQQYGKLTDGFEDLRRTWLGKLTNDKKLKVNDQTIITAMDKLLPGKQAFWDEYLQHGGPFSRYFTVETEGDDKGKIFISEENNTKLVNAYKQHKSLTALVNADFKSISENHLNWYVKAAKTYEQDCKTAVTKLLQRLALPVGYKIDLSKATEKLLKGYLDQPWKLNNDERQARIKWLGKEILEKTEVGKQLQQAAMTNRTESLLSEGGAGKKLALTGFKVNESEGLFKKLFASKTDYTGLAKLQERVKTELGIDDFNLNSIYKQVVEHQVRLALLNDDFAFDDQTLLQKVLPEVGDYLMLALKTLKELKNNAVNAIGQRYKTDVFEKALQRVLSGELARVARNIDFKNKQIINMPVDIGQQIQDLIETKK